MSNKYLEKIAKQFDEIDAAAGLTTAYGTALVHKQYTEGHLTGRQTLYHGSSKSATESIRKNGLTPSGSRGNTISKIHGLHKENEGLVFTTKNKFHAHTYSAQQDHIDKGIHKPSNHKSAVNTFRAAMKNVVTGNNKGITKVNLPDWKPGLEGQINPEYTRWKNSPERILFADPHTEKSMKHLLQDSVHVVKGGIGTEYIKGSNNYKPNSISEIKSFVSGNKGRFAKGVGKAALGASLATGGLAYLKYRNNKNGPN